MEKGRPPFDPDDDLDFDFETTRRKHWERDHPGEDFGERTDSEADASERPSDELSHAGDPGHRDQPGSGEPSSTENPVTGDDPFDTTSADPFETGERSARRREKPRRRLKLGGGRSRRRDRRAEREAAAAASQARERPAASDDPFATGESAAVAARRERRHHRDLPAKVRRRQAAAVGVVVVAVAAGAFALLSGGGGGDEDEPLALKRLVGQTVIGKLGKDGPDKALLRRVKKGQLGGVIVTPLNETTLSQQVAQLQSAADAGGSPPPLVMIDQEGGEIKRLPGPPDTPPAELGEAGDADAAREEGEATGNYLKDAGVNVDLAPVMDVNLSQTAETIGTRTFSDDPAVVSEIGSAFIEGMQSTGVAATAKHFPGLGPATVNTDFSPAVIAARSEVLDAALLPFQAAVDAGVELMMVSSASYPSYGPENTKDPNKPANAVAAIVQNLLRGDLGFQGLVITDDLQSIAIQELGSPAGAGVAAIGAGCDLILYARSDSGSEQGFEAVFRAVKKGTISRDQVQTSYDRILSLKGRLSAAAGD